MLQLIGKEYLIQKRLVLLSPLILTGLIILWVSNDIQPKMIYSLGCLVGSLSLIYGGIGHDEEAEKFLLTLPVEKRDIVVAKYTTGLAIVLLGALMTVIVVQIMNAITGGIESPPWAVIFGSIQGTLISVGLSYGLYYKFGYQNTRFLYVGYILLGIAGSILYTQTQLGSTLSEWVSDVSRVTLILLSIVLTVVVYGGSLVWSIRVMNRKEL